MQDIYPFISKTVNLESSYFWQLIPHRRLGLFYWKLRLRETQLEIHCIHHFTFVITYRIFEG